MLNCVLLTCRICLNTNCGFPGGQIGKKLILEKPGQFFVMTENPKIFPRYLRMSQGSFYEQVHPIEHFSRVWGQSNHVLAKIGYAMAWLVWFGPKSTFLSASPSRPVRMVRTHLGWTARVLRYVIKEIWVYKVYVGRNRGSKIDHGSMVVM